MLILKAPFSNYKQRPKSDILYSDLGFLLSLDLTRPLGALTLSSAGSLQHYHYVNFHPSESLCQYHV